MGDRRILNEAYKAAANLFTQFKLFALNYQQRCEPDYDDFLKPLRHMKLKYHVTTEWLRELKVLSDEDL